MKDALMIAVVAALALVLVGVVVLRGGDSTILVSPPEAIAEDFVRAVVARRYPQAMQFVDPTSGVSLTTVRLYGDALRRRIGAVNQIEGEAGAIRGSRSTASARIDADNVGEVYVDLSLVRRHGLWRVADWTDR